MYLTTAELSLVEQRVANDASSIGVAYLFWFFLWIFSAHRFYPGRPGTAILQILSYFILIGFIWLFIDAFLIPGMIRDRKDEIRRDVMTRLSAYPA